MSNRLSVTNCPEISQNLPVLPCKVKIFRPFSAEMGGTGSRLFEKAKTIKLESLSGSQYGRARVVSVTRVGVISLLSVGPAGTGAFWPHSCLTGSTTKKTGKKCLVRSKVFEGSETVIIVFRSIIYVKSECFNLIFFSCLTGTMFLTHPELTRPIYIS